MRAVKKFTTVGEACLGLLSCNLPSEVKAIASQSNSDSLSREELVCRIDSEELEHDQDDWDSQKADGPSAREDDCDHGEHHADNNRNHEDDRDCDSCGAFAGPWRHSYRGDGERIKFFDQRLC